MKNLFITLIFFFGLVFLSCNKVDSPVQTATANNVDNTTAVKRNILLEEFTGQRCSSCPEGAREIERIVNTYGDQIIPVSIHAGSFATSGPDATKFVTNAGTNYHSSFNVNLVPGGIISRIEKAKTLGRNLWEPKLLTIKDDEAIADIIITNNFNTSSRELYIKVDSEWLRDGANGENYKLQIYLIEDHIIAYQKDGLDDVPNYDHKHVLRKAINTNWGTAVTITNKGTIDTQNFTTTLNKDWNEANCKVVAFIYKEGPEYEVMQAKLKNIQ